MNINRKVTLESYKDLIVWKKSYKLCLDIYKITKEFPRNEEYGLTSQIKRSALSVPSNIAEGYNRQSRAEYIRFLYIAYGSLAELETQLMLAKDLKFTKNSNIEEAINLQNEVQKIMFGLIKSIKAKHYQSN